MGSRICQAKGYQVGQVSDKGTFSLVSVPLGGEVGIGVGIGEF